MTREQNALAAIVRDVSGHIASAELRGAAPNEVDVAHKILHTTAVKLALYLGRDNDNFSREAFLNACGVGA